MHFTRSVLHVSALLVVGCHEAFSPLGNLFDLGPVEVVHVSARSPMRVGDSITASAFGYNKVDNLTRLSSVREWSMSDSTVATLRLLTPKGDSVRVTAKRVGRFRLVATIEQVPGSAEIAVDP